MALKMSYIPAQFRVRIEFTKQDCDESSKQPTDLRDRVLSKLDSEVKKGQLEAYLLFMERLDDMWKMIRKSKQSADTLLAITHANGVPPMPEVVVAKDPSGDDDVLALLSINATASLVKTWRVELFHFKVRKTLIDLGIKRLPNPGQLHGLYLQA